MASFGDGLFYVLIFLSVYAQVFFLVTFLENRKKIVIRTGKIKLLDYPSVTIAVPCFNEEKTVEKTVLSLIGLNYPKDKLKIFLINDGSTDNTPSVINKFSGHSNVRIFHKENGGKYTALNLGLDNSETDFFGCLDADSFADPESLVRIMSYFEKDEEVMAVAPSIMAVNTKSIVQKAQKAEYEMVSVYVKKMLGFLGAIHVTPGPLTVFRKKVFDNLGHYRHAHNTEDMEIAYRMQKNHYKIEQCNDAYVYTNTPSTIAKLYKQRVRWIYGFINNTIDYRKILFRRKYGNFSVFTIPTAIVSIFAVCYFIGKTTYTIVHFLFIKISQYKTIGFHLTSHTLLPDPFFINMQSLMFLVIFTYVIIILSIMIGKKMAEGKWAFSFNTVYFLLIFSVVAPFWVTKAVLNTIIQRKPSWR